MKTIKVTKLQEETNPFVSVWRKLFLEGGLSAGALQEHFRNVLGTLDLNDRMAQTHEAAITLAFLSHVLADSPAKRLQLIKVGQVPSGDPVPPVGPVPSGDPVPPVGPDLAGSDPCFILFCSVCLASDVFGGSCSPPGCAEDH